MFMISDYYFLIYTPITITLFKINSNLSSLFFFLILSFLSVYNFIVYDKNFNINTNLLEYNYCGDLICKLSFQYFIIDGLIKKNTIDMKIHHLLLLLMIGMNFYYQMGYNIVPYLSLGEISSIFLISKKMVSKKYYNLHNNLFIFNFFIFRILLLPILLYNYYFYCFPNDYYLLLSIPLLFDNILHGYWSIKFIKKF